MEGIEPEIAPPAPRPRTSTVVGLLVAAALIFSYLIGYALMNALAAAEVIAPWPRERDPRMKCFAVSFASLIGVFVVIGTAVRSIARRQLRRIDEMEQEVESPISH